MWQGGETIWVQKPASNQKKHWRLKTNLGENLIPKCGRRTKQFELISQRRTTKNHLKAKKNNLNTNLIPKCGRRAKQSELRSQRRTIKLFKTKKKIWMKIWYQNVARGRTKQSEFRSQRQTRKKYLTPKTQSGWKFDIKLWQQNITFWVQKPAPSQKKQKTSRSECKVDTKMWQDNGKIWALRHCLLHVKCSCRWRSVCRR